MRSYVYAGDNLLAIWPGVTVVSRLHVSDVYQGFLLWRDTQVAKGGRL